VPSHVLEVNPAEASDRIAVFAAWRRLVELAAEQKPLALVIEDLHWSSDSLLDLFEFVMQPRGDLPCGEALIAQHQQDVSPHRVGDRRRHVVHPRNVTTVLRVRQGQGRPATARPATI